MLTPLASDESVALSLSVLCGAAEQLQEGAGDGTTLAGLREERVDSRMVCAQEKAQRVLANRKTFTDNIQGQRVRDHIWDSVYVARFSGERKSEFFAAGVCFNDTEQIHHPAEKYRDKSLVRSLANSKDSSLERVPFLSGMVVLKPRFGTASEGVESISLPEGLLVEEFIEGEEFAFDAYMSSNRAFLLGIFNHVRVAPRIDMKDGLYVTNNRLVVQFFREATGFLTDIFDAFPDLRMCAAHVEAKWGFGRFTLIEINPCRFGSYTTECMWRHCGMKFSPYEIALDLSKGNPAQPLEAYLLPEMSDTTGFFCVREEHYNTVLDKLGFQIISKMHSYKIENVGGIREIVFLKMRAPRASLL